MDITLTLQKQLIILNELLDVLKQENEALKNGLPNDLINLINKKEDIINHLNLIEEERFNQMGDKTLKQFIEGQDENLEYLLQEYKGVMKEISHYHELNQHFSTLTYNYSKDMLDALLTSAKEKSITYGRGGNMYNGNQVKTTVINRHI